MAIFCFLQAIEDRSLAQVIPDKTLGSESSTINSIDELRDRIEGGAIRGENLFHSFEEFGIPEGLEVYFANPEAIKNIFSRVTGDNISEIFGTLGVEGTANLFLINPNGIVFGENAQIDVGGSFIATTAEKVHFENDEVFNVRDRDRPILTWNAPIGLGLEETSGEITVQGFGHNLTLNTTGPTSRFPAFSSLDVRSGKTLALVAKNITLDGGVLNAPEGHIELGAVISGKVFFDSVNIDNFQYNTEFLGNIRLINRSLADASGLFGGSIHSVSDRIAFSSGSGFFVQNQFTGQIQNIQVDTRTLDIIGGKSLYVLRFEQGFVETTPDSQFVVRGVIDGEVIEPRIPVSIVLEKFNLSLENSESAIEFLPSFIFSEGLQNALGNNIDINAKDILVSNGAQLTTRSFENANAGNIDINEAFSIEVRGASNTPGFAERSFEIFSLINSTNFGLGKGGNLDLTVDVLNTSDGGSINSINSGVGEGGNVTIDANTINLIGSVPNVFLPSNISSSTISRGNAGNLKINSNNIFLRNGASISSSTFAEGDSGEVKIFVEDSILIEGIESNSQLPSSISSNAALLPAPLREAFFLPPFPTGDVKSLTIFADELKINNTGQIGVQHDGKGNAGELQIESNKIELSNQGRITAAALFGEGGNINIQSDRLTLQNSLISAEAGEGSGGNINIQSDRITTNNSDITSASDSQRGGNLSLTGDRFIFQDSNLNASAEDLGDGGNVTIDADTVLGINSDITATAERGDGGNITIDADGVLGFREGEATKNDGNSDVDATSRFGQDGTVIIINPLTTTNDPLIALIENFQNSPPLALVGDCYNSEGEPLVTNSVHDDIPETSDDYLDYSGVISDDETVDVASTEATSNNKIPTEADISSYLADTVVQTEDGRIYLVNKGQLERLEKRGCLEVREGEE